MYGPLPLTTEGHKYIFTAVDMFSKLLYTAPVANNDALTISNTLFNLFTLYGVCDTLISDRGSEFVAAVTQEVCRLLDVPQQFTPSFVHHCLGACERTHLTLAQRLTHYMDADKKNWESLLPAITFSMNNSVNTSLGYSPFEIIYGQRPKFPLTSHLPDANFDTIPNDMHSYLKQLTNKLDIIRNNIKETSEKSQLKMMTRANANSNPLSVHKGDYVYLLDEPRGKGRKLQNRYAGPYTIDEVISPHMVALNNPHTGRKLKTPVHLDRLKMAYVREPNPVPYFVDRVITQKPPGPDPDRPTEQIPIPTPIQIDFDQTEPEARDQLANDPDKDLLPRRSARRTQAPMRYGEPLGLDSELYDSQTDNRGYHKIKRILCQRQKDGRAEYFVHIKGEPSQNAIWVPETMLDSKAKRRLRDKPPPVVD